LLKNPALIEQADYRNMVKIVPTKTIFLRMLQLFSILRYFQIVFTWYFVRMSFMFINLWQMSI